MSAKPRRQPPPGAARPPSPSPSPAARVAPPPAPPNAPARPDTGDAAAAPAAPPPLPVLVDADPQPAKRKPVRDRFTMPPEDHALIGRLKERALQLGHAAKKSELLRAGLKALAAMDDFALRAVLQAVPPRKAGKRKKAGTPAGRRSAAPSSR